MLVEESTNLGVFGFSFSTVDKIASMLFRDVLRVGWNGDKWRQSQECGQLRVTWGISSRRVWSNRRWRTSEARRVLGGAVGGQEKWTVNSGDIHIQTMSYPLTPVTKKTQVSVGLEGEKWEPWCAAGRDVNWHSHGGRQSGGSSEN